MKKQTRLYNVIFPIWMLFLFPQVWLVALPGNLLIDCAVVLGALFLLKHEHKWKVLRQIWWKVWLLGFAADFMGITALLPSLILQDLLPDHLNDFIEPVLYNCFLSPVAFLWTAAAVALSGVCIYLFDREALRSCPLLTDRQRHLICLALAIITAPWTFFIPVS